MPAAHGKQFTIYMHAGGPNPWKVIIVLEELGLSYETIYLDTTKLEHKQAAYTDLNPNGRLPTIVDHANNDFVVWESGAIMLYIVGKYDPENKISFADFNSTSTANQYLMFQMSGQGPYYGQAVWFATYHPEKIPSAIVRYVDEIKRILGVLEAILADKEFLVGNHASYADLSFVPWNWLLELFPDTASWREDFPNVGAWDRRLNGLPSVKKAKALRAEAMKG